MKLQDVMDEIGAVLRRLDGVEVFAFLPNDAPMPAAMVGFPGEVTYDRAMGRGMDQIQLPVVVLVGSMDEESTRNAVCEFIDGDGPRAVKAVLEQHEGETFGRLIVRSANVQPWPNGGVTAMAAIFVIDIYGRGAA